MLVMAMAMAASANNGNDRKHRGVWRRNGESASCGHQRQQLMKIQWRNLAYGAAAAQWRGVAVIHASAEKYSA